jgi:chromosome segregation ATPase
MTERGTLTEEQTATSTAAPGADGAHLADLRAAHRELGDVRQRLAAREATLRDLLHRLSQLEAAQWHGFEDELERSRDELRTVRAELRSAQDQLQSARDELAAARATEVDLRAQLGALLGTKTFRYVSPARRLYGRARTAARRARPRG